MNTKRDDTASPRPFRTSLGWTVAVLAAAAIFIWWPGCRQYPPVTSRDSLDLIKLVYSACNTRDPRRLARAEARIDQLVNSGQMTPAEEAGFRGIVDLARSGDWKSAEAAALRFASDQVGQAP